MCIADNDNGDSNADDAVVNDDGYCILYAIHCVRPIATL